MYVKSASVLFVLGFDEDDGDVIDFDNDGEVDLHKWVSRHFLFYSRILIFIAPVSISEC